MTSNNQQPQVFGVADRPLHVAQGEGQEREAGASHAAGDLDLAARNVTRAVELGTLNDLDHPLVYEFVRRICGGL